MMDLNYFSTNRHLSRSFLRDQASHPQSHFDLRHYYTSFQRKYTLFQVFLYKLIFFSHNKMIHWTSFLFVHPDSLLTSYTNVRISWFHSPFLTIKIIENMSTDQVRINIIWFHTIIKTYLRRLSNTQVGYLYSVSWFRVFWLMLDIFPARLRWVGHTPNSPKSMLIINKWVNEIEFIIFYIILFETVYYFNHDYIEWLPAASTLNIIIKVE